MTKCPSTEPGTLKKLGKWSLCYFNSPVQARVVCICLCAAGVRCACFCFWMHFWTTRVFVGTCLWVEGLRHNCLGPV